MSHHRSRLSKTTPLFMLAMIVLFPSLAPAKDASPDPKIYSKMGDAERGKVIFMRCSACHNETAESNTKTGPNLNGVFGRKSGHSDGYDGYSKAIKESNIVWNEENLNAWLQNPRGFLPGNKMNFAGVRNQKDRNDLMAYLRSIE